MKKVTLFIFVLASIMIFASCSEDPIDDYARYYTELIPDQEGQYLLFSVEDDITSEQLEEQNIGISNIIYESSSDLVNNEYPKLNIEKSPAYILFDTNGMVYKTYDYEKLLEYLKENPQDQVN
ncbi:hypothetical protein [Lentibacillus salicampi]|uniref:Thioredoxin domain-containing protein n=1 Tax=Lentibacillus salicampi TaxID=175306 RepID=A0A4Y9A890_9BACI|nr:hypothetical protein [Lentibacillus salicampi]TFJ92038.1 hypothetical protein E4U82_14595 [Lentibacillus salicampi]